MIKKGDDAYLDALEGTCLRGEPDLGFDLGGRLAFDVSDGHRLPADLDRALVAGSETSRFDDDGEQLHRPVLDLDIPARLVPSSTPGHSHLYLDVDIPWPIYQELLRVLAAAGVVESGYAEVSVNRGASFVRLPWVRKVSSPIPD